MHRTALAATVVIAAALLASAAHAQRPDDRRGMIGGGGATATSQDPARPDDRAEARGPGAVDPSSAPTILVSSDGFDYSAAAVGAAVAMGIALAAGGLLGLATRRHGRRGALTGAVLLTALAVSASAAGAQTTPGPSCNGVFSSAAAGDPGHIARVAHFVKELSELLGLPPGALNSEGARMHCERLAG